jgi:DNA-binding NtrC family response regulator
MSEKQIGILLTSAHKEDGQNLRTILDGTVWSVTESGDHSEALRRLKEKEVSIVLCDRNWGDTPWQQTMQDLIAARRGACVILLSNVADQYLWDEVVRLGGFDVLTRPFQREQVTSLLMFAYTHWKTKWPKTGA